MLEKIWMLADQLGEKQGIDPIGVFDPCGLILIRPLRNYGYFCTPHNSLSFATTGGDGVHYGFLMINQLDYDFKPIVMTVPMADTHNVIVAENLEEFLGLGYHVGWFTLEQIVNDAEDAISYFADPDTEKLPEREKLLVVLRKEINIEHVPLSLERLEELKNKYVALIEADSEP